MGREPKGAEGGGGDVGEVKKPERAEAAQKLRNEVLFVTKARLARPGVLSGKPPLFAAIENRLQKGGKVP